MTAAPQNDLQPGAPVIQIRDVSKHFGDFVAVDSVNLDIHRGEIFSILGASGCGKTTLLRMIAGFEVPTAGRIFIDGVDVTDQPPYRRPVNMMFQSYAIFPHMTVEQNVAYGLQKERVPKSEIRSRVAEMLGHEPVGDQVEAELRDLVIPADRSREAAAVVVELERVSGVAPQDRTDVDEVVASARHVVARSTQAERRRHELSIAIEALDQALVVLDAAREQGATAVPDPTAQTGFVIQVLSQGDVDLDGAIARGERQRAHVALVVAQGDRSLVEQRVEGELGELGVDARPVRGERDGQRVGRDGIGAVEQLTEHVEQVGVIDAAVHGATPP